MTLKTKAILAATAVGDLPSDLRRVGGVTAIVARVQIDDDPGEASSSMSSPRRYGQHEASGQRQGVGSSLGGVLG